MRPYLLIKFLAVMATLLLAVASLIPTTVNAETSKYQSHFRDYFASTNYFYNSEDGCEYGNFTIVVYENMIKDEPGAPARQAMGYISLYSDNWCEGIYRSGNGEITPSRLSFSGNLRSAYLKGTANIYWWVNDESYYESVSIETSWTGIGEITRSNEHDHNHISYPYGSWTINTRSAGTSRNAQATASIVGEMTNINFICDLSLISFTSEGYLNVYRQNKP